MEIKMIEQTCAEISSNVLDKQDHFGIFVGVLSTVWLTVFFGLLGKLIIPENKKIMLSKLQ